MMHLRILKTFKISDFWCNTDALTWFVQVGLGLVQRQSRGLGLGLAAGRQRGRSSSSSRRPSMRRRQSSTRSRPPVLRRRWRCPRTGATAEDVFQALASRRVHGRWTWMDGREAAKMMPNKQASMHSYSSSQ
jgi:hypothetical protein